jgi:Tol biopolymer transport system component
MQTRIHRAAVIGLVGVVGLVCPLAQSSPPITVLPGVLPSDATTAVIALTADGQRTYYVNQAGEVWLFDRVRKNGARIAGGQSRDVAVSPTRDAVAYARSGDKRTDEYVWLSPLDPKTGLAVGPERRLSSSPGDVPSFSPDGHSLAFASDDRNGVGQSIVVVPVGGGAERVVVPSVPSSIDHIRWTPDGKSLYFGVNPPVACVPDWSCLPLAHDNSKGPATIQRTAVSGGPVSVIIAAARSTFPGLSPDGTVVAYADASAPGRVAVTDADGRPLGGFALAAKQTVLGWLDDANLLVRSAGNVRRLHLTSLSGGPPRVLFESAVPLAAPTFSPDGQTIAAILCTGGASPCELRLLNADGSPRHTLVLPDTFAIGIAWSPDQRWISYTGNMGGSPPTNQLPRLVAIEVSTDRVVPLGDTPQSNPRAVFWLPDSRRLLVSDSGGNGPNHRMSSRLVDVSGESTPLRDLALGEAPGWAVAIDASTALVASSSSHDYHLASLVGDSPDRVISVDGSNLTIGLSPDRQWIALTRNASRAETTEMNVVDLCRVDGSARVTIDLPFFVAPGPSRVVILPGAKHLIVVEALRQDADPGVYLVTVATKTVSKLFTYPSQPARSGGPEIAVSPDGHTVLYTSWEALTPSFSTMNLSVFRQPVGR